MRPETTIQATTKEKSKDGLLTKANVFAPQRKRIALTSCALSTEKLSIFFNNNKFKKMSFMYQSKAALGSDRIEILKFRIRFRAHCQFLRYYLSV